MALNTPGTSGTRLTVTNIDAANGADLGGAGVAGGTGYPLAKSATVTVDLEPGEVLYAIQSVAAAPAVLAVLAT